MFTKRWLARASERAIKTAAQTLVYLTGSDAVGWVRLDWKFIGISVGMMSLLSLATSILTTPAGDDPTDPSVVS
jgi:hypothetical protein